MIANRDDSKRATEDQWQPMQPFKMLSQHHSPLRLHIVNCWFEAHPPSLNGESSERYFDFYYEGFICNFDISYLLVENEWRLSSFKCIIIPLYINIWLKLYIHVGLATSKIKKLFFLMRLCV